MLRPGSPPALRRFTPMFQNVTQLAHEGGESIVLCCPQLLDIVQKIFYINCIKAYQSMNTPEHIPFADFNNSPSDDDGEIYVFKGHSDNSPEIEKTPKGSVRTGKVPFDKMYQDIMSATEKNKSTLPDNQGSNKDWELSRLKGIHFKIVRMHVAGMRNTEIADQLGITSATVTNCLNSDLGRQQVAIIQATQTGTFMETQTHLEELAPVAVITLGNVLLDSGAKHADKIRAADSILDRTGFKTPDRSVHTHLTLDDLEDIKKKARSNNILAEAEDIEVEEVEAIDDN